jgi:hypothetical protein
VLTLGVMFPMEVFEMREYIVNLYLSKPRQNAEKFVKTYKLYSYGDIYDTTV